MKVEALTRKSECLSIITARFQFPVLCLVVYDGILSRRAEQQQQQDNKIATLITGRVILIPQ